MRLSHQNYFPPGFVGFGGGPGGSGTPTGSTGMFIEFKIKNIFI